MDGDLVVKKGFKVHFDLTKVMVWKLWYTKLYQYSKSTSNLDLIKEYRLCVCVCDFIER